MANGDVDVTEGSGLKVGTYTISEDAVTRHLQRVSLNSSAGVAVTVTDAAPSASDYGLVVGIHPDSQNANGQATMANSAPVVMSSDFVGTSGYMKKEDVASADGDAGVGMLAVRKATPANTSGTDGDYEFLQMSAGRLWTSAAIDTALPAGTNAIGKLAANSGVDIGDVDVTSISAGENHLGEVGGKSAYRVITMSTDTGAYASGDLIADTQQYDAFFRKTDGTGVINTITITEKDAQGVAYYIIFHRTSTSMGSENSAPNISDANLVAGIQHIVTVSASDFVTVSGTKIATLKNLGLPVMAVSGTDDLYISILNSTGTPTYASGEIQLGIGVLLD
jgi:hypothetical protein